MKKLKFIFLIVLVITFVQFSLQAQSDYSKRYLILDHLFIYNNPTVNYEISVTGKIPVNAKTEGLVRVWFPTGEGMSHVASLFGDGKVVVSGRGNMNLGQFQVKKLNYKSSMNVTLKGKTRYLKMPELGGSRPVANLSLEENWDGDFEWDIETSDPDNDDVRYDMLKQIAPKKIPDSPHTGRTIEYYDGFPRENSTYEYTTSIPGMGTFRWRYTYTEGEIYEPERNKVTVNPKNDQLNFDDERPKPKDYINLPEAKLGPPLEEIEWDLVDINSIPSFNKK